MFLFFHTTIGLYKIGPHCFYKLSLHFSVYMYMTAGQNIVHVFE